MSCPVRHHAVGAGPGFRAGLPDVIGGRITPRTSTPRDALGGVRAASSASVPSFSPALPGQHLTRPSNSHLYNLRDVLGFRIALVRMKHRVTAR